MGMPVGSIIWPTSPFGPPGRAPQEVARKDGGLVDAFTALHARTQPFEHVRIKEDIKRICEDPDEALLFVTTTAYDVLRHIILAHSLEDSSCSGSFGEERYTISYRSGVARGGAAWHGQS